MTILLEVLRPGWRIYPSAFMLHGHLCNWCYWKEVLGSHKFAKQVHWVLCSEFHRWYNVRLSCTHVAFKRDEEWMLSKHFIWKAIQKGRFAIISIKYLLALSVMFLRNEIELLDYFNDACVSVWRFHVQQCTCYKMFSKRSQTFLSCTNSNAWVMESKTLLHLLHFLTEVKAFLWEHWFSMPGMMMQRSSSLLH